MTGTTYDGAVRLEVTGRQWRRSRRPPLELTVLERDEGLLALPTDQSGGARGGDRLRTEVVARKQARLDWLPPASALYFPSADREGLCLVETRLEVDQGSALSYRPKVSIPCAGARVEQVVQLDIAAGAAFFYWDGWADGRTASGERRAFASVANRLEFRYAGRILYQERWSLSGGEARPADSDPAGLQGACQWYLGLAVGPAAHRALVEACARWSALGQPAEVGQLDDEVWIARVLSSVPRG